MLLISSHVLSCGEIPLPKETVIRVNLAWLAGYEMACTKLEQIKHDIFLDNPVDRVKPPSNKYSMSQILDLINRFPNIKYLAVSNVESGKDLTNSNYLIPYRINIVPKIETIKGIKNIHNIALFMDGIEEKDYIMLDHDDLCSDIIRHGLDPAIMYTDYINPLMDFCNTNNINLLRTQGVVFSTEY